MLQSVIKKIFGTNHKRTVKRLMPLVRQVNDLEQEYQSLSDEALQEKTHVFRERIKQGEKIDDLLPEAFAAVKNACRRLIGTEINVMDHTVIWNMIPYDVQVIGAIVLHRGNVAEMQTGEGKTLVATMPLYLNALTGNNCQLVTVNDYLAKRDAEWVGTVLRFLRLTVGCIQHTMSPQERREQYACDVTYGTNSEFGFDYLRDMGMATSPDELVQRNYSYVIIDEVDSILIDEARTPLIISGPTAVSTHRYDKLKPSVEKVVRKQQALCTQIVHEAKETLSNDDLPEEEMEVAIEKLLKVKFGMPKQKQLIRLLENPAIRRRLDKQEMEMHSDQNRGMLQELKETLYFTIDEKAGEADLSEMGRKFLRPDDKDSFVLPDLSTELHAIEQNQNLSSSQKTEKKEAIQQLYDERSETIHNIAQLLRAYCLFDEDVHYVVKDNKVLIVDEFTGRLMPGRRFSEGLHQALEAKEDVKIERETQTLATITIQNYFRMYDKLSGMTGTAETEASELKDIYNMDVVLIPTNKPCIRKDQDDRIFKNKRDKYRSIIGEIEECNRRGQPVLVGTVSVDVSEILSRMLRREKIPHNVLNAKNHQNEAEIVARAGQKGSVTIATNMAGRGTDIQLGEGIADIGGLYVISSERHDSRRIDRQLRGRCARQGDNGSSRFYISLEDDLMRLFGSDRIASLMEKFGFEEDQELSHPLLNRSIETAQRKVEQHHYSIRKRTLQFDDVVNKQREVIYSRRKDILFSEEPRRLFFEFIDDTTYSHVESCLLDKKSHDVPFDQRTFLHWLKHTFPIGFSEADIVYQEPFHPEKVVDSVMLKVKNVYETKIKGEDNEEVNHLERRIMLNAHDRLWQEHLYSMDEMRSGIYLRSYGQKDPLVEYKQEAFKLFEELMDKISDDIASSVFRSATSIAAIQRWLSSLPQQEVHSLLGQFSVQEGREPQSESPDTFSDNKDLPSSKPKGKPKGVTFRRSMPKIRPNEPCPCDSGKKYKKCCGK